MKKISLVMLTMLVLAILTMESGCSMLSTDPEYITVTDTVVVYDTIYATKSFTNSPDTSLSSDKKIATNTKCEINNYYPGCGKLCVENDCMFDYCHNRTDVCKEISKDVWKPIE